MALSKTSKNVAVEQSDDETEVVESFDPRSVPGFHVIRGDGVYLGTFIDNEQAQHFIDGHVVPSDAKATIVEGPAEEAEG